MWEGAHTNCWDQIALDRTAPSVRLTASFRSGKSDWNNSTQLTVFTLHDCVEEAVHHHGAVSLIASSTKRETEIEKGTWPGWRTFPDWNVARFSWHRARLCVPSVSKFESKRTASRPNWKPPLRNGDHTNGDTHHPQAALIIAAVDCRGRANDDAVAATVGTPKCTGCALRCRSFSVSLSVIPVYITNTNWQGSELGLWDYRILSVSTSVQIQDSFSFLNLNNITVFLNKQNYNFFVIYNYIEKKFKKWEFYFKINNFFLIKWI